MFYALIMRYSDNEIACGDFADDSTLNDVIAYYNVYRGAEYATRIDIYSSDVMYDELASIEEIVSASNFVRSIEISEKSTTTTTTNTNEMPNGIIRNSVNFVRADYDALPKCLIFDANSCEFSNGDELTIEDTDVSAMPYENGYVLELSCYDHESQLTWSGYTVFVQQGSITPVWSYHIDYEFSDNGKYEYAYIDELVLDNSQPYIATKLYPNETEQWKDLLVACMTFE